MSFWERRTDGVRATVLPCGHQGTTPRDGLPQLARRHAGHGLARWPLRTGAARPEQRPQDATDELPVRAL